MPVAKEMTMAELKKVLRALSYDQVEDMLCVLYRQNKDVSRFLNARFNGAAYAPKLLEDFKLDIDRFIPMDFHRTLSMSQARKALTGFRKAAPDSASELEMLLYFTERCVQFTSTYGDIDEPFYDSAARAFAEFVDGLNGLDDDTLFERWRSRVDAVLSQCIHIGWGFGDQIGQLAASIIWNEHDEDS